MDEIIEFIVDVIGDIFTSASGRKGTVSKIIQLISLIILIIVGLALIPIIISAFKNGENNAWLNVAMEVLVIVFIICDIRKLIK